MRAPLPPRRAHARSLGRGLSGSQRAGPLGLLRQLLRGRARRLNLLLGALAERRRLDHQLLAQLAGAQYLRGTWGEQGKVLEGRQGAWRASEVHVSCIIARMAAVHWLACCWGPLLAALGTPGPPCTMQRTALHRPASIACAAPLPSSAAAHLLPQGSKHTHTSCPAHLEGQARLAAAEVEHALALQRLQADLLAIGKLGVQLGQVHHHKVGQACRGKRTEWSGFDAAGSSRGACSGG